MALYGTTAVLSMTSTALGTVLYTDLSRVSRLKT